MKKQIQINPADNVVVAVDTLSAGDNITVGTTTVTVREEIPAGHKVALQDFKTGRVHHQVRFPYRNMPGRYIHRLPGKREEYQNESGRFAGLYLATAGHDFGHSRQRSDL